MNNLQSDMRKIILNVAVTLDGYIEGPNGEFDWCFTDEDYGMTKFMKNVDAIFFGRRSYELMLKMGSNYFSDKKRYVFSGSLESTEEGWKLINGNGNLAEKIKQLKQQEGKNIWLFGGTSLLTTLLELGLVDELMLSVHPLLLGEGKPLFQDIKDHIELKQLSTTTYPSGLVQIIYSVCNN